MPEPLPRYYPSPSRTLAPVDADELVSGLRTFIANESDIEREKTSLALKSDFNMSDAFRIFDRNCDG